METVRNGETFPAKYGRSGFRRNFTYAGHWRSRYYETKQIEAYAVWGNESWLVISIVTKFFCGPDMRLTYDPTHNIAYIRLAEAVSEVETIRVSDELNVDLSPDGKVFGFELLNANEQLRTLAGKLVVENESTGATVEVALP